MLKLAVLKEFKCHDLSINNYKVCHSIKELHKTFPPILAKAVYIFIPI